MDFGSRKGVKIAPTSMQKLFDNDACCLYGFCVYFDLIFEGLDVEFDMVFYM